MPGIVRHSVTVILARASLVRYAVHTGDIPSTCALQIMGIIAEQLRASLRDMAAADARLYRGLSSELAAVPSGRPALPGGDIAAAIALLEANGYTVTKP
jgi:hypothetical protein